MVVDRVLQALVVLRVPHRIVAERHVADHGVEHPGAERAGAERLVVHLSVRVEQLRDRGRHRVELDAGHARAVRRPADEVARAGAGFEHVAAGEPEVLHRRPHLVDERRVGVVRVQHVAPGVAPLRRAQERGLKLLPLRGVLRVVRPEHTLERAPPGPAGEDSLLRRGRGPVLRLHLPQRAERRHVRAETGALVLLLAHPARGEVLLTARPELAGYPSAAGATSSHPGSGTLSIRAFSRPDSGGSSTRSVIASSSAARHAPCRCALSSA